MAAFGRLFQAFMAPAEDPRQAYGDAACRGPEVLAGIQSALRRLAASHLELEARAGELRRRLSGFEEDAREAVRTGQPDAARQSLARRRLAAAELAGVERQLHDADLQAKRLALVEERLAARIEAYVAREQMLEARQSAAEAQVRLGEALAGIADEIDSLGPDLGRWEEQAEELEARAAAIDRLIEAGALEPTGTEESVNPLELEAQLAELERELAG